MKVKVHTVRRTVYGELVRRTVSRRCSTRNDYKVRLDSGVLSWVSGAQLSVLTLDCTCTVQGGSRPQPTTVLKLTNNQSTEEWLFHYQLLYSLYSYTVYTVQRDWFSLFPESGSSFIRAFAICRSHNHPPFNESTKILLTTYLVNFHLLLIVQKLRTSPQRYRPKFQPPCRTPVGWEMLPSAATWRWRMVCTSSLFSVKCVPTFKSALSHA